MDDSSTANSENGHWLDAERLRVYPLIFIGFYVLVCVGSWLTSTDGVDLRGKPLGTDFITFWSAAQLALVGTPVLAYDSGAIFEMHKLAVPANSELFLWHHPPTFMVLVYPLAFLPYIPAYFVWAGLTLAAFVWTMVRLAPSPYTLALTLAFGGTFVNFIHGQTGFLLAALVGGIFLCLEKRPAIAALLIALMTIKPHLGVLIPIALICGGYWRVFGYAIVACLGFWALTTAMLGTEMWIAGVENLTTTRYVMDEGLLTWAKMPSLYATAMMLGNGTALAYSVQIVFGLAVAVAVALAWRGPASLSVKAAVLVSGSVLLPPYIFDYDLTVLAIAIALLAQEGQRTGWRAYEREILVMVGVAPMLGPIIAETTGIPITFFMVTPLFIACVRRAFASAETIAETADPMAPAMTITADASGSKPQHTD